MPDYTSPPGVPVHDGEPNQCPNGLNGSLTRDSYFESVTIGLRRIGRAEGYVACTDPLGAPAVGKLDLSALWLRQKSKDLLAMVEVELESGSF